MNMYKISSPCGQTIQICFQMYMQAHTHTHTHTQKYTDSTRTWQTNYNSITWCNTTLQNTVLKKEKLTFQILIITFQKPTMFKKKLCNSGHTQYFRFSPYPQFQEKKERSFKKNSIKKNVICQKNRCLTVKMRRPVRSKVTQYTDDRCPRILLCIFICW